MILETTKTDIVSTVSDEDSIGMTIDNESIQYIIGSLTNIYPNKRLAILREYPTNALDSHIEAGQTRPIEITLPSSFNPNFVVQDWGIGMGRYELEKIYGVYGKSTKRKSNAYNGAYGLGSKSALTLVQSFNLVTVKDGKKFTVIINKDKDDVGKLTIISEVETDEPNGVKVTIPAGKASEFTHLAETFFLTWKPGTVLVNGAEPKHIESDAYEAVDNIGYISTRRGGYGRGNLIVSMGGICYKVGSLSYEQDQAVYGSTTSYHLRQQEIVLLAEMGDVELVPSREDVAMSDKTMAFVAKQTRALVSTFLGNIKKKIDEAPTRMEAIRLVEEFPFAYSRNEYTWQGKAIPASVETTWARWSFNSYNSRKHKYNDNDAKLDLTMSGNPSVLIDTTGATIENSTILRHLKSWAKSDDIVLGNLFIGALPSPVDPWMQAMIDEKRLIVESADSMAEKAKAYNKANRKAREVSTEPRDTLRYPVYTVNESGRLDSTELSVSEIKELDSKLFYLDQDSTVSAGAANLDFGYHSGLTTVKEIIDTFLPKGSALVIVSNNRKAESFTKRMGDLEIRDALKVIEKKIVKDLGTEVKLADEITERIATTSGRTRVFKAFAGKELKSEVFSAIVENLVNGKTDTGILTTYDQARRLLGWNDSHINTVRYNGAETAPADTSLVNDFLAHYPLLDLAVKGMGYNGTMSGEVIDSLVVYLNATHEIKGEFTN